MKKNATTLFVTLIFILSMSIGNAISSDSFGEVDEVIGRVSVIRADGPLNALKGMELLKDDTLKTGKDSSITVTFAKGLSGSIESEIEMTLNDLFLKSKINALKKNIKRPDANATPAKINVHTIGGMRGTEEVEKKSKGLKNDHHWEEKVD